MSLKITHLKRATDFLITSNNFIADASLNYVYGLIGLFR